MGYRCCKRSNQGHDKTVNKHIYLTVHFAYMLADDFLLDPTYLLFKDLDVENERKIQMLLQDKFEMGRKLVIS